MEAEEYEMSRRSREVDHILLFFVMYTNCGIHLVEAEWKCYVPITAVIVSQHV